MTKAELDAIYEEIRGSFEIQPNEVVIVGKVRSGKEAMKFDPEVNKDPKAYIKEKYQFMRLSELKEEFKKEGMKASYFFHIQMAMFGDETVTLPNGKKVKRSNRSAEYGWATIFDKQHGVNFDEIKQEVIAGNFDIVGTPDDGRIKLNNFALFGSWIKADVGFKYNLNTVDATTGKFVPLTSNKIDRATGKVTKERATSRLVRFFLTEGEYGMLRTVLANRIEECEKERIKESATSDTPDADKSTVIQTEDKPVEEKEKEVIV